VVQWPKRLQPTLLVLVLARYQTGHRPGRWPDQRRRNSRRALHKGREPGTLPQLRKQSNGRQPSRSVVIMSGSDLSTLKSHVDRVAKIHTLDGEVIVAKILFVSESEEDVIYDLVSTNRESQYEKLDQQPAYRIRFEEISA